MIMLLLTISIPSAGEASMLASLDLLTECPESRHIEQARQLHYYSCNH